jgi:hypothetical protein
MTKAGHLRGCAAASKMRRPCVVLHGSAGRLPASRWRCPLSAGQ